MFWLRGIDLTLSAAGAAILGALFLYVTFAHEDFDQRAKNFAISKIEEKFDEKFRQVAHSETMDKVARIGGEFSDKLRGRIESLRASLDAGLAEFIADVLAAACKLDCERKEEAERAVKAFFEAAMERYGLAIERVTGFIEGQYDEIMGELRSDLRIFSGSSFVALLFALLLAIFRGPAAAHLVPISIALTASTAIAAIWYVFGQDWVMTVIFSDYWGWAYSIFLGTMSVFLIDIAANKARFTSVVFNTLSAGSFNFSPC